MNDFSELERDLKKLRPRAISAGLLGRVEAALAQEEKIVRPARFQVNWLGLGLGLAAAAAFLLLARIDFQQQQKGSAAIVSNMPGATPKAATELNYADYRATGLTQVVYDRRDEGIVFPEGSAAPARRLRTARRETMRWQNRATGAQLRVSYPTEEVTLVPVSGQ